MGEFEVVLPGDTVSLPSPHVGPGLCVTGEDCSSAVVTTAGLLKGAESEEARNSKKTSWVDYSAKRVSIYLRDDNNIIMKMGARDGIACEQWV